MTFVPASFLLVYFIFFLADLHESVVQKLQIFFVDREMD